MPDEFKQEDVILSYRDYYNNKINTWKRISWVELVNKIEKGLKRIQDIA